MVHDECSKNSVENLVSTLIYIEKLRKMFHISSSLYGPGLPLEDTDFIYIFEISSGGKPGETVIK